MNLLTRYFEQRSVVDLAHPRDPKIIDLFGLWRETRAGVPVTEKEALSWTAFSAGVRLLAETLGSLPLGVYREIPPPEPAGRTRREELRNHPVAQLLAWPNDEMTPFELVELMQGHAVWWGTGYAQIVYNGGGMPVELWPMNPDRVTPQRDAAGELEYRIGLPEELFGKATQSTVLPADEMLVIRGFSRYGVIGDRVTRTFREAIGLGLATELFGAAFFGAGANAGGVLEHPGALTEEAQERLRKQKEKQVKGLDRAHRLLILEEGMKFHQTTIEPEKAQFLGLRKFQVTEAARILRIPPHMLYDLERATFSNIEHQAIQFVTYTMTPWAVRWEQRLKKQLLGPKDFARVYFKFNMNGLLRGDMQARMAFYQAGIQNGWFSQNDVRELEDLNPIKDGDTYRAPANLTPVDAPPAPAPAKAPPVGGPNDNGQDDDEDE